MSSNDPIDWSKLKELTKSPKVARGILEMFIEQLPSQHKEILALSNKLKKNYSDEDTKIKLSDLVHKVHGSACYCSVPKLKNELEQLDGILQSSEINAEEIESHIEKFSHEALNVLAYYKTESNNFTD